jgi:hypothetical protein
MVDPTIPKIIDRMKGVGLEEKPKKKKSKKKEKK